MRIVREIDPKVYNGFINHPEVRDWVIIGQGHGDVSALMGNPKNIFLTGEHGAIMFLHVTPGVYEVQPTVLPSGRGKWALDFCRETTDYIATGTDAWEVCGRIPAHNLACIGMQRAIGMSTEFTRMEKAPDGSMQETSFCRLTLQDWIMKYGSRYEAGGVDFLAQLEDMSGVPMNVDMNKARYVGIAKAMLDRGQLVKAMTVYNRWAYLTRQSMLSLVKRSPLTLSFGDLKIEFSPGMKVTQWEQHRSRLQ